VHEYDIALKSVIRRLSGGVLESLTGFAIERWHNVELPEVRSLRADLIGETAQGSLVHVELQSTNDAEMALRMVEYAVAIYRALGRLPEQIVLYVGREPLRMQGSLAGAALSFRCRIVDVRALDAEPLLASANLEDNVIAVLMRLSDEREAVRRILRRISAGEPGARAVALRELMLLAGLRSLGDVIIKETTNMPILDDIMDHDYLGPMIRRERLAGLIQGEQTVVMRLIEKRFGPIPASARQRLEGMTLPEVEETALRVLDAESLEDVLGRR
jgi:hypothetical protein